MCPSSGAVAGALKFRWAKYMTRMEKQEVHLKSVFGNLKKTKNTCSAVKISVGVKSSVHLKSQKLLTIQNKCTDIKIVFAHI